MLFESPILTYYFSFVFIEPHGVWFHDHFHENQSILMPGPYALHETRPSHRLFVGQVREFWNFDTGRARVERREGEALSHGCEASRVIWARSLIGVKD